jgi:hypothetical protein
LFLQDGRVTFRTSPRERRVAEMADHAPPYRASAGIVGRLWATEDVPCADVLAWLGGEDQVLAESAHWVIDPAVITVAEALLASWQTLRRPERVAELLLDAAGRGTMLPPGIFGDLVDVLLDAPQVLTWIGDELHDRLLKLARDPSPAPLHAAIALEGATRLVLGSYGNRYLLLGLLAQLPDGDVTYKQSAVRVLGAVMERWNETPLRAALRSLAESSPSSGVGDPQVDAQVELGLLALRDALSSDDEEQVLRGLRETRNRFAVASAGGGDARIDADIWGLVIDLLLAFHHAPASAVADTALRLRREVLPQHLARLGTRPGWRSGRADVEVEWLAFAEKLTEVTERLDEPAWRTPAETTAQVLEVYRADRTIRLVTRDEDAPELPGVRALFAPRIEDTFVRERGLRALLDHWLQDTAHSPDAKDDDVAAARRLRNAASGSIKQVFLDAEGKRPGPLGPRLRALIGDVAEDLMDSPAAQRLAETVEARLADRDSAAAVSDEYIVEQTFRKLRTDLAEAKDLVGEIGDHYLHLVRALLRFLRARLDPSQRKESQTAYLFQRNPPPLERALGEDLVQWLHSGDVPVRVLSEVRDYAGGRVDVLISWGGHAFVIELKREQFDARRDSLERYLPQTIVYQGSSVGLGALLVLDLTTSAEWVPGLRDNVWVTRVDAPPGARGEARWALVGVVPGNRIVPSSMYRIT